MADYAIGDIQGCYNSLRKLLDHIQFDDQNDQLWLVGDLVNRGPNSLAVLRFLSQLPHVAITLGNHDLYLLYNLYIKHPKKNHPEDTLTQILEAPDRDILGHWLTQQSILIYSKALNCVMTHAGMPPMWTLAQAQQYASELESVLHGENLIYFLKHMFGNHSNYWDEQLTGLDRLRTICNYFTRMRFCDTKGQLILNYKGATNQAPANTYPWYATPNRQSISPDIIFGHWAALMNPTPAPGIYALDSGCIWGNTLSALRLQDKQWFSVDSVL